MNSLRTALALVLILLFSVSIPRRAEATIGAGFQVPTLIVSGVLVAASGVGGVIIGIRSSGWQRILSIALGVPVIGLGLMLLDGEQAVAFQQISAQEAQTLGITPSERLSFNLEVDQVNSLASYVETIIGVNGTPELAGEVWLSVRDAIEPETWQALVKVSQHLAE
jgi:hypothetical protein